MNLPSGEICSPLIALRLRDSVNEGVCLVCACTDEAGISNARTQREKAGLFKEHLRGYTRADVTLSDERARWTVSRDRKGCRPNLKADSMPQNRGAAISLAYRNKLLYAS